MGSGEPFVVSSLADRMRFPAEGYLGGRPGGRGGFSTSLDEEHDPKLSLDLPAGARFTLDLPGGGGFYDPADRDPAAVADDVAKGPSSPPKVPGATTGTPSNEPRGPMKAIRPPLRMRRVRNDKAKI